MGGYRLSVKAEEDLTEIYTFGIFQFGLIQAQKYVLGLEESFLKLSKSPFLGRDASELYLGLREFVYKSHMVFYSIKEESVLIVRILHQSRDYKNYI